MLVKNPDTNKIAEVKASAHPKFMYKVVMPDGREKGCKSWRETKRYLSRNGYKKIVESRPEAFGKSGFIGSFKSKKT